MASYKNIEGCEIGVDVYVASHAPSPLLLMIHGGGFVFGSRRDISKGKIDYFLNQGIHVATIDYRLSPESDFSDTLDDVADAIAWIKAQINQTGLSMTRLFVMGYSAGGFLAYHVGTLKDKPDGIIGMYGYADLTEPWCREISGYYLSKTKVEYATAASLIGSKPISSPPPFRFLYYLYLRQQGKWMNAVLKADSNDAERLRALSPLYSMNTTYPKTLVIHGMLDQDVPYSASKAVVHKLETIGVSVHAILLENEGHDFDTSLDDPKTRDVYDAIVLFIKGPTDDKF